MVWGLTLTQQIVEYLRFIWRSVLIVSTISISLLWVYVITKGCWFAAQYLNKTAFEKPW